MCNQFSIYLPQSKVLPPSIFMDQLLPITQLRSKPANWGTKLGWICSQEQKGSNYEIFLDLVANIIWLNVSSSTLVPKCSPKHFFHKLQFYNLNTETGARDSNTEIWADTLSVLPGCLGQGCGHEAGPWVTGVRPSSLRLPLGIQAWKTLGNNRRLLTINKVIGTAGLVTFITSQMTCEWTLVPPKLTPDHACHPRSLVVLGTTVKGFPRKSSESRKQTHLWSKIRFTSFS